MNVVTRATARTLKLTRYYTGKPCAQGHTAERLVCNMHCVSCHAQSVKRNKRTEKYKSQRRASRKRSYSEKRAAIRAQHTRWAYGLAPGQFEEMMLAQKGLCAICKKAPQGVRGLHVDHDHSCCSTNARSCGKCVRALLCDKCNTGLGKFFDSPELLRSAAAYLEEHAAWLRS